MSDSAAGLPAKRVELWLAIALYLCIGLVLFPALQWLTRTALLQDQLHHALMVLGFLGVILVIGKREKLRPRFELSGKATKSLLAAVICILIAVFTPFDLIVLGALCLVLYSGVLWIFGDRAAQYAGPLLITFGGFTAAALLLPVTDWQLRLLAGEYSGMFFRAVGMATELGAIRDAAGLKLLLVVNGRPFEVAAECNGFGVMSSAALLALLIGVYQKRKVVDLLLLVVASVFLGFLFNIVRIIIIVALAPLVGENNYMLMHEIVGTAAFLTALILVWWLVEGKHLLGEASKPSRKCP